MLTIGASYITDDGKTRLYVRIGNKDRGELSLYITQTIPNGVVIDWGDASPSETIGGTGKVNTTHIYTSEGNYTVTLSVSQGCVLGFGDGTTNCILGGSTMTNYANLIKLEKVEIGAM